MHNLDDNGKKLIENIKTTMACENQFLSNGDIDLLTKLYNNEITLEDAITLIKNDIFTKAVK